MLDRQRYDGGFALWRANGEAEPWLSAYAMDFLLRAQAAGATVPEQAMADGLKFIADAADAYSEDPPEMAAPALSLVRTGRGRARAAGCGTGAGPEPRQVADAAGPRPARAPRWRWRTTSRAAEAAFARRCARRIGSWWNTDYGTALRDQAAMAVLLKESGLLPDQLARLVAALPGADLKADSINTQEQAWTAAAAEVLGRDGRPPNVAVDGRDLPRSVVQHVALTGPATARNAGDRPVWQSVSVSGVTVQAPPASRSQMRIRRNFMALDGTPLDLEQLRQNTVFVLLLEGRSDDDAEHRAMLLQGLPAGWEIAGRFAEGDVPGMAWLGKLTATEAQPAADDRFAAVLASEHGQAGLPRRGAAARGDARRLRDAGGRVVRHVRAGGLRPPGRQPDQGTSGRKLKLLRLRRNAAWRHARPVGHGNRRRPYLPARPVAAHGRRLEVVDREGRTLALLPAPGGVWRFRVAAQDVAPALLQTLVATEDRHFWSHPGVNPLSPPARRRPGPPRRTHRLGRLHA